MRMILNLVIANFTNDCNTILVWLSDNGFVANPDIFHFISSSFDEERHLEIQGNKINNSKCKKLLGIKINFKLSFETHVSTLLSDSCPQITLTC